jgi:hypothetical protein
MARVGGGTSGALTLAALLSAVPGFSQTLPEADVDCAALPNPLFIEAGDTQMRMLGDLGRRLRDSTEPLTLVYLPRSTCTVAENVFTPKNTTEVMRYVPSLAEQPMWDGTPRQCRNQDGGIPIDVGIGATFISSCSQSIQSLQPAAVRRVRGPVQGYGFVVPEGVGESVQAITREEAYFVFGGVGAAANAVPWIAEPAPAGGTPSVFIRGVTTSTLLTLAANVAPELLPAARWAGYRLMGQEDRSSVVIAGVAGAQGTPLAQATIGLLGVELYDRERNRLDILAYQARGQDYAYYPDSSPTARDKRPLRDGHYVPWGYTEYLVRVDAVGNPVNPSAARLLDIVTGARETRLVSAVGVAPAFDLDGLSVVATNGLVPECAMTVQRERDGGDLSLYAPNAPCGCFFETVQDPSLLTNPPEAWQQECKACTSTVECGDGVCRRGFCEVR